MLRSDKLLALDDVTEACQLVVDHLEHFADSLDNQETARLFLDIAERHRGYVDELDEQVHRLGELPSRPDSDREFVEYLASLFRGTVAEDREEVFLDKAIKLEEQVCENIDSGLAIELPDEVRTLFTRFRSEIDQIQSQLKARVNRKA